MADSPLPTFSDGKPAQLVALIPTVIKVNELDTDVMCTNLAGVAVDIGLEVFDKAGVRGNTISAGNGAILTVGPGATVTFGTTNTAVLHEDAVITLEAPVTSLRNGSGRVVATSTQVGCVALAADKFHAIVDPLGTPPPGRSATERPPSLTTLLVSGNCDPARCDDGDPCTADGCDGAGACTHSPAANATPCDDGDVCTSGDVCGSGVCAGAPVVCGADTPCFQTAACDAATGGCVDTAPFSTCVPGGGDGATDCAAEWVVDNPTNPGGITNSLHTCRQGDGNCDFDVDRRACTFRVRICLNNHDVNLPACQSGELGTYELRLPPPRSRGARTMLAAVGALAPSSRGGRGRARVTFAPPDAAADQCTALLALRVRIRRSLTLKVLARTAAGTLDKDRLKLRCLGKPKRRHGRKP